MTSKLFKDLDAAEQARIKAEWDDAHDFDPRDPLFGLNKADMSGPKLKRRSMLRLMAASGTLAAWHLMPGVGTTAAKADGHAGGTLRAGWAGVGVSPTGMRSFTNCTVWVNVGKSESFRSGSRGMP